MPELVPALGSVVEARHRRAAAVAAENQVMQTIRAVVSSIMFTAALVAVLTDWWTDPPEHGRCSGRRWPCHRWVARP